MRVLSWNVAGRKGKGRLEAQIEAVRGVGPDVVALQEVSAATHDRWVESLKDSGYQVCSTRSLLEAPYPGRISRRYCNLTATRGTVSCLDGLEWPTLDEARVAFPEKHLATRIEISGRAFDFHNTHLPPGSSRHEIKPQAFLAIRRRIDRPSDLPLLLCGDFNTPRSEDDDRVQPFGQAHPGVPWWGSAERDILEHPRLVDVYRHTRERGTPFAVSHVTRSGPKRYDHLYADPDVWSIECCAYRGDWLDDRLSDHAGLEVKLQLSR